WSILRSNLVQNSLQVGVWGAASGPCVGSIFNSCTAGTSAGRAIAYRTWTNNSNSSVTFSANAQLEGSFSNSGGDAATAVASMYLFNPTLFSNTLANAGQPAPNFLTSGPSIDSLFPANSILASDSETYNGPTGTITGAPTTAGPVTVGPNQSITIL